MLSAVAVLDARDVGGALHELRVHSRGDDERLLVGADGREHVHDGLGLVLGGLQLVDDEDVAGSGPFCSKQTAAPDA